jgi:endonuclease/exonuclease/phosphatase (EEP) superfamily protein YafD
MMLIAALAFAMSAAGQLARGIADLDVLNFLAPLALLLGVCSLTGAILIRQKYPATVILLALAAVLFSGERIAPEFLRDPVPTATGNVDEVVILTTNVWRNNTAPAAAAAAIAASGADVVLLQESKGIYNTQHAALTKTFPYVTKCRVYTCELVIYSRWPLDPVRYRFRAHDGAQIGPSLIHTRVHPPGRPDFEVVTMHFPRTTPLGGVERTVPEELAQTLPAFMDAHMILAGDLNLTPWTFALQRLDHALRPMTRITHSLPSYPGNMSVAGVPFPPVMPIDHIYVGPAWLVRNVETLPIPGADHRAVRAVLEQI